MQNLMLISNPLKRLQKESCKKSFQQKSGTKIEFLTFIAVFTRFQSNTSFERIFCIFSHGFKLSIKFYVFDTHMEFFCNTFFSLFLHFLQLSSQTLTKQLMCLSIPFHIHPVKKSK